MEITHLRIYADTHMHELNIQSSELLKFHNLYHKLCMKIASQTDMAHNPTDDMEVVFALISFQLTLGACRMNTERHNQ